MEIINRVLIFLFLTALFANVAEARKFNLNKQSFAPYFIAEIGTTGISQDAFKGVKGSATSVKEEVAFQYAGELGVLLTSQKVGLRLGVLFVSPQKIDSVEGASTTGVLHYNLTSKIFGVFPVAHLEFSPVVDANKRVYFALGGGTGTVTILNEYVLTSAGSAQYGISDFTEESLAYAYMLEGSLGFEMSMADNVTVLFIGGYRYLVAEKFTHQRSVTTVNGPVTKGEKVSDSGTDRALDLSSAFAGIGFRFYIN